MPSSRSTSLNAFAAAAALSLLAGCGPEPVTYYEVPHEEPPRPAPPSAAPQAGSPALHWHAPEAWTEKPASSMRLGSFAYTADDGSVADISVIAFPDSAGGLLANINRWRGQVGLDPIDEAALATVATREDRDDLTIWRVDLAGTAEGGQAKRILGAIIPFAGQSWFFKMMGPDAVVRSQRENFDAFIASIHPMAAGEAHPGASPAPSSETSPAPATDPHAGIPGAPPLAAPAAGAPAMDPSAVPPPPASPEIRYTTPEGWEARTAGGFRIASFAVPGSEGEAADVSVITLAGPAGGELANVNRWRGQVGLAPVAPDALGQTARSLAAPAGTFRIHRLDGPSGQSILAAILPAGERTFFIKMTGPTRLVASQQAAFEAFLQSLQIAPSTGN